MGNYSFKTYGLPEPINRVIEGHNFVQGVPHTAIYSGITGLTFKDCNLTNCDVPGDAEIIGCLQTQTSFCSHLHPEWALRGFVPECAENCSHLTDTDTINIDGVLVDVNKVYNDLGVE